MATVFRRFARHGCMCRASSAFTSSISSVVAISSAVVSWRPPASKVPAVAERPITSLGGILGCWSLAGRVLFAKLRFQGDVLFPLVTGPQRIREAIRIGAGARITLGTPAQGGVEAPAWAPKEPVGQGIRISVIGRGDDVADVDDVNIALREDAGANEITAVGIDGAGVGRGRLIDRAHGARGVCRLHVESRLPARAKRM